MNLDDCVEVDLSCNNNLGEVNVVDTPLNKCLNCGDKSALNLNDESLKNDNESGSNEIGKFKNSSALLKAYNELQAEFTKKCQKLADLQKSSNNAKNDNLNMDLSKNVGKTANGEGNLLNLHNVARNTFDKVLQTPQNSDEAENTLLNGNNDAKCLNEINCAKVDEKLDKSSENLLNLSKNSTDCSKDNSSTSDFSSPELLAQIKNFFAKNPNSFELAKCVSLKLLENPALAKMNNGVEIAHKLALCEQKKFPEELVNDDDFIAKFVINNDKIKRLVQRDIVNSSKNNSIPKVMGGAFAGGAVASALSEPKTLSDAGRVVELMFRKG